MSAYDEYLGQFTLLQQNFRKLNPPAECQQLHQAYDYALSVHINTIDALKQFIANRDLTGVALFGLTVQNQIDKTLSVADKELARICQHYDIPKPFKIGDER